MATLTTQGGVVRGAGQVITPVAATGGGDAMSCGQGMFLRVVNGGGSSITVTMTIPAARTIEAGVPAVSPTFSVTNGTTKEWGPVDAQWFSDPTTSLCTITYSAVTSVTVAAVQYIAN
jgi:hypothetical protein